MILQFDVDQPESIKRGFNARSTIKLEIDIPSLNPQQREIVAQRLWDGWRMDRQHPNHGLGSIPQPDIAGVLEKINSIIARNAEETAAEAQKLADAKTFRQEYSQRLIANPAACVELSYYAFNSLKDYDFDAKSIFGTAVPSLLTPEAYEVWQKQLAVLEQQKAAADAEKARVQQSIELFAAQKKERQAVELTRVVGLRGTPLQQQMHQRGLLDAAVAMAFLKDEAFAALHDWPLYQSLTIDDCETPDEGPDAAETKLYFRADKVDHPTEAQFARQLEAEAKIPGAQCEIILHMIEDDNDAKREFTPAKFSLKVTVEHACHTLTREFALD